MTEEEEKFLLALSKGFIQLAIGSQDDNDPLADGNREGGDYWWQRT